MFGKVNPGICSDEYLLYSYTDTEQETEDGDENYVTLNIEEGIIDRLTNIHLEQETNKFTHNKSEQVRRSRGTVSPQTNCNEQTLTEILRYVQEANAMLRIANDAWLTDLFQLLRKWCLEGPYEVDECVFFCYSRNKSVCIKNTVNTTAGTWRNLALIVKKCLQEDQKLETLVKASPMFRYYGELYPDNGRDEMIKSQG